MLAALGSDVCLIYGDLEDCEEIGLFYTFGWHRRYSRSNVGQTGSH